MDMYLLRLAAENVEKRIKYFTGGVFHPRAM
jgi:hypothetical protein